MKQYSFLDTWATVVAILFMLLLLGVCLWALVVETPGLCAILAAFVAFSLWVTWLIRRYFPGLID